MANTLKSSIYNNKHNLIIRFCGDLNKYKMEFLKNGTFTLESFGSSILLTFSSDWANTKRGFKLKAKILM